MPMKEKNNNIKKVIESDEILTILPHRFPFLLIDRVLDYEEGKSIQAIKNISLNESYFLGHFPQNPIVPGVLIIESIAQAVGILAYKTRALEKGSLFYLAAIDNARFKKIVKPGDQMIINISVIKEKKNVIKAKGLVFVDNILACEADVICMKEKKDSYDN